MTSTSHDPDAEQAQRARANDDAESETPVPIARIATDDGSESPAAQDDAQGAAGRLAYDDLGDDDELLIEAADPAWYAVEEDASTSPHLLAPLPKPASEAEEGQWVERAMALEAEIPTADDDTARIAILLQIGAIWRDRLMEKDAAASAYERALELDPRHDEAFSALERIYSSQGDSAKLIALLLHGAEQNENLAERIEYLQRIAQLYEYHGQPDKAALVLETALDAAPDHPFLVAETRRLQGLAAALYEQQGGLPTPDPLFQQQAERAASDPIALLSQQLEQTDDPIARADIYEQLATLWQRQRHDSERAIDCLRKALHHEPARASALDRLEQIFLQQDNAEAFGRLLAEQAHEASSPAVRGRLLGRLAALCEGPLDNAKRALEVYEQLRRLDGEDSAILDKIVGISRQLARWDKMVEALGTLARLPRSEHEQAGLLHQIGTIQQYQLGDADAAEHAYADALEVDPAHLPTVARLGEVYRAKGSWNKLAGMLERAEAYAAQPGQRADLLQQAGVVQREHLHDDATAAELLERSLKLDSHRRDTIRLLADIYWQKERYERLEPLLETLLRTLPTEQASERLELLRRLIRTTEKQGKIERAIEHCLAARKIDPASRSLLLQLAELAYRHGDLRGSYDAHRQLIQLDGGLSRAERLDVQRRLAEVARKLDLVDESIEALEAVALETNDREAHRALADLLLRKENWAAAAEARELLLDGAEQSEAFELHLQLGDLLWHHLGRTEEAEEHFQQAVGLRQQSRTVLHRLLDLYSDTKRWRQTIEVCDRLAALESDDKLRAKYHYAAAVIARDEIDDPQLALELFNRTLDADPGRIKAFREIDDLLTRAAQWRVLAQNYSRMLKRLPKKGFRKLKARLWQNFGEVLRTHCQDTEGAINAFRAASALDPADFELRHVLTELYQRAGATHRDALLQSCHELIDLDPAETEPYHLLRRAYMELGQFDRAWCVCAALSYLKHASEKEHSFFRQYRARTLVRAGSQLTDDLWQRALNHPDQDRHLNAILALVARPIGEMTARDHADFGIRRADRADLNDESQPLLVVARYVSAALAVSHPDLHLRAEQPGAMLMAHTKGAPSFVAGAHLLGRHSRREMAFIVAKQLTFLRPEYFLRYALNTPEKLESVLEAIYAACERDYGANVPSGRVVRHTEVYLRQNLLKAEAERLAQLVERLASKGRVDLLRWWNASELTADRVGLLLCGDIDIAAHMISAEPGGSGGYSRSERIKQLIQFLCSESYFLLRERLGLTIDQQISVGEPARRSR